MRISGEPRNRLDERQPVESGSRQQRAQQQRRRNEEDPEIKAAA
jgi:hypothetical protein